ncbi:MAG: hypothetical protein LRZ85_09665 [Alphaproteobacteria bacterium]|nr:hypothetical protein [Alphaproteobacteria bacterium]
MDTEGPSEKLLTEVGEIEASITDLDTYKSVMTAAFNHLSKKAEASRQRVKEVIARADETNARARESIKKSQELRASLNRPETDLDSGPQQ